MPTDADDARVLLRLAPDDYVAERARLVKQARADGDRARAGFYQSLKRPTLSVWAVLAAGDDAEAVRGLVTATTALAQIQADGNVSGGLAGATQRRRTTLEALVDRAVTALARWDSGAGTRRPEIRGMVDQLSRHPELADAWIDATLREIPDDALGFAAFADLPVTARSQTEVPVKAQRARHTKPTPTGRSDDGVAQRTAERAARAAQAAQARQARHDVTAAARELAAAERRVDVARSALRNAEEAMRIADDEREAAEKCHHDATARLDANQRR